MELVIAHLVNLILVSVFVGNEFAIGIFVHPVLGKLPDSVHISSVQVIGKIMGKVMPFWIPLIILSALPILYLTYNTQILAFWLTTAAVICIVLMLIISLTINVPLNNKTMDWNPHSPPSNWLKLRRRWDKWHAIRMIVDFAALLFFLLAAII